MSHCVEATSVTCKCVSKHLKWQRCSIQTNNINGSNALRSFSGSLGYIFDLLNIKQPGKHISVQLWKAEREREREMEWLIWNPAGNQLLR